MIFAMLKKGLNIMHYYPHNIADFNNATRHLTRVQRSVYRDAIDLYYDKELPLVSDMNKLEMRLMCHSDDEKNALKYILSEFFTETNDGYINERCDIEIAKYRANIGAKARAGIASAASRKNKSTDVKENSTHAQQNSTRVHNQELRTNNQELINKPILPTVIPNVIPIVHKDSKDLSPLKMLMAMGVSENISRDWITVRKEKKQAITQTALNRIKAHSEGNGYTIEEALKICCENGWAGFNVAWLDKEKQKQKTVNDFRNEYL